MRPRRAALALVMAAACTEAPPQTALEAAGAAIDVHAPERAAIAPALLGTGPSFVDVTVANRGNSPLDVSKLALRLEATWGEMTLECVQTAEVRAPEPSVLLPGKSFTFERALDCRLPLEGRYEVRTFVAFGRDRSWRQVSIYDLEVTAPPGLEARPVNDSGLFATIGASPVAGGSSRLGHPRAALALTNSSSIPLELPPMRVETRVLRDGAAWSCVSAAKPLATPPALGAGAVHREPFDVSCLGFDVPGRYDVEVILLVGADRAVSLGHVRIEVQSDPARLRHAPFP